MSECNPIKVPMESKMDFSIDPSLEQSFCANIPYQNAIGAIMYLYQATRPDLGFSISCLSRFNNNFQEQHWKSVKRIFRYLKQTINYKLTFTKDADSSVVGYSDASYHPEKYDPRSVTGYVFKFQGAAISWLSKRQSTIAISSMESEYYAITSTAQEALWLKGFASELLIHTKGSILIYCDNKSAIDFAKNNNFSHRSKHIDVRHHFLKQRIDNEEIKICFLPSSDMLADGFTKALASDSFSNFLYNLGLLSE